MILVVVNMMIANKERTVAKGQRLILQLAPVDPRSLMQGDYMRLSYAIASEIEGDSGSVYLELDSRGVASRVFYEPALGRVRLRYRRPKRRVEFGAESFFFQEGQAQRYEAAEYGELKVDLDGNAVLTHLLDENLQRL